MILNTRLHPKSIFWVKDREKTIMVILSLAAQAIETVVVRTGLVAVEAAVRVVGWAGGAVYGYLWPPPAPPKTEVETLREEVCELKEAVRRLRDQGPGHGEEG
jgi:hypothetical protein